MKYFFKCFFIRFKKQELNSKLGRLNDTLVDKCETKDEEIYVKLKAS